MMGAEIRILLEAFRRIRDWKESELGDLASDRSDQETWAHGPGVHRILIPEAR